MSDNLPQPRAPARRASRAVLQQAVNHVLQRYPCFEASELTPRAQGQLLVGHIIIVSVEGGCFYVRVVVQFDGVARQAREDELVIHEQRPRDRRVRDR